MRRTKAVVCAALALCLIILPFLSIAVLAVATPARHSETYICALDEKYKYLNSVEGEKIIVVGGSSVAFGLDSEALSEYTGMPVVNFGLFATLGTRLMLDLSDSAVGEGDIVIISPEMSPQTLSMYFNVEASLMALSDDFSMLGDVNPSDWLRLYSGMWDLVVKKLRDSAQGAEVVEDALYQSKYFNRYGDYDLPRSENIMKLHYDPNAAIDLSVDMLPDDFDEFVDYLNAYIKSCEDKGATVYFDFCPMNEAAIVSTDEEREEFVDYLKERINCEFLSDIEQSIFGAGYLFDTNFHLNESGVQVRTLRLGYALRMAKGNYAIIYGEDGKPLAEAREPALKEIT